MLARPELSRWVKLVRDFRTVVLEEVVVARKSSVVTLPLVTVVVDEKALALMFVVPDAT